MLELTLGKDRRRRFVAVDGKELYKLGTKCFSACKAAVSLES
jgi:hypothetical protein